MFRIKNLLNVTERYNKKLFRKNISQKFSKVTEIVIHRYARCVIITGATVVIQ
jgi:hypothetical protein